MREMCAYCAKWHGKKDMTPLYEEGKALVLYYCDKCIGPVRENIQTLPWRKVYRFGTKESPFK